MYQETDAPLTTEESPSEAHPALFVIFYLMLLNVTKLNSTNFLPFISSVCSFIYSKHFFELIMLKMYVTSKPATSTVTIQTVFI